MSWPGTRSRCSPSSSSSRCGPRRSGRTRRPATRSRSAGARSERATCSTWHSSTASPPRHGIRTSRPSGCSPSPGCGRGGFLVTARYGNPLNRDHFREKVIRPALRAAGLPETLRTYDIRHSHASLLIDLGANPLAVAQRMGHSDPAVTLRNYGHLFEGAPARLSEQLDALREATASQPVEAAVVSLEAHRGEHA